MDGLFTTNCIMPPRESYQDRVYTTSVVGYDYKEFMEITKGSLKNLFYGENRSFLEIERFRKIQGEGEGMRQNIMWNTE